MHRTSSGNAHCVRAFDALMTLNCATDGLLETTALDARVVDETRRIVSAMCIVFITEPVRVSAIVPIAHTISSGRGMWRSARCRCSDR